MHEEADPVDRDATVTRPAEHRRQRLPAGRRAELAAYVAQSQQVTVAQLAERFDVSPDTVRRDLQELHQDGLVVRTHGGAVSVRASANERRLDDRLRLHTEAKDRIGALAATLVADSSVIMLNAGTTTLAVVRHLRDHRNLTVATNNLRIPTEISPDILRDFYIFGGAVRLRGQATVGAVRFQSQSGRDLQLQCDLAIVSVGAVSGDVGYSTSNVSEAVMMGEMMDRATRVAVLADSSKFGEPLFAQVAELGRATYLVTEKQPPTDLADALRAAGVQILVADEPSAGAVSRSLSKA
jgi:DeoR/GlpR family transcriptional regulator of sugar metabolism